MNSKCLEAFLKFVVVTSACCVSLPSQQHAIACLVLHLVAFLHLHALFNIATRPCMTLFGNVTEHDPPPRNMGHAEYSKGTDHYGLHP